MTKPVEPAPAMQTLSFDSKYGEVTILMRVDRAPKTCQYFVELIRASAFDAASIFRIVTNSGVQANDDNSINVVQIGPVQRFEGPRHRMEHEDTRQSGLTHRKWVVSAARFDLGELYGSFFICLENEPELDFGGCRQPDGQGFAAFGEVVDGFDALEKIFAQAEASDILSEHIPIKNVKITYEQ